MSRSQTSTAAPLPNLTTEARRAVRWAWASLGLMSVSFPGAVIVGDWLLASQGYQSGSADIEMGAVLRAGLPALLVLVAPTVPAAWFGFKARRLGHPGWLAPVLAAGVIAAGSIALNLLQVLAALVAN